MKKLTALLLMTLMLFGACACADNYYLIEDSDTRLLTESELWKWDYDALGYVFNEIFARHGYHFKDGGKYQEYFENQDWYAESEEHATNEGVYTELNDIEWRNERLIKDVRGSMRKQNTTNPRGISMEDIRDSRN